MHKFTNMSTLLFTAAVLVFLMGLISEQITVLNYRDSDDSNNRHQDNKAQ